MQTINERLVQLRKHMGMNVTDFARHIGIDRSRYTRIETGPNKPALDAIEAIAARVPELSLDWLLTGAGNMLRPATDAPGVFTGGTRTQMGAIMHEPGSIEAQLPAGFNEDMPTGKGVSVPMDAKEYAKMLTQENEALRKENKALNAVITEQRDMMKEQRENTAFLRRQLASLGKSEGSQSAPVAYAVAEPQPPIGFKPVVRQMWPALPMRESTRRAA